MGFAWGLVTPSLVALVGLAVFPLIYLLRISFMNYQMLSVAPPTFIGLGNYIHLFKDPTFWHTLLVTFAFALEMLCFELPVGLLLALLIKGLRRHQQVWVTLLLIPTIISPSVASFQWVQIFDYHFGPLNYLLHLVHIPPSTWTADPRMALPALLVVDFWQWTPFMILLLYAGLQSLPAPVLEAARVDGSTPGQVLWNVILPLLRPVMAVAVILRLIAVFKLFDIVYVMTSGGPGIATETLAMYTYLQAFTYFNMGYAAAIAFVQLVIITILAKLVLGYFGREGLYASRAASASEASLALSAGVET